MAQLLVISANIVLLPLFLKNKPMKNYNNYGRILYKT